MMSPYVNRIRQWIFTENRLGSLDPEIYPTVVVTLGTVGWGALILMRKFRDQVPPPAQRYGLP